MKARILLVFISSVLVGIFSTGISLVLPNQYTAQGLLLITRKTDTPSPGFFTYEGDYAQQNAGAYTGTFISMLQSPDNLKSTGLSTDIKTLSRVVKVKREGTQAVMLNTKGKTPTEAVNIWNKVSDTAIKTHTEIIGKADPLLTVTKTSGSPAVIRTYPSWQTIFLTGFLFSAVILSSIIIIIRYLKEENDN